MKESELREHLYCSICKRKVGHDNNTTFAVMRMEHHLIDTRAVMRQSGLEMMLGSAVLAEVMGPNEEMTKVMTVKKYTICAECLESVMEYVGDEL